jgi:glycosyltransferase involved in cell wall biosynthesis
MNKNILFTSYHCYLDWSNGASITVREILHALTQFGWNVNILSGAGLDSPDNIDQIIADQSFDKVTKLEPSADSSFSLRIFIDKGMRSTIFCPIKQSPIPSKTDGDHFLQLLQETVMNTCPKILLTYGGYHLGPTTLRLTKNAGVQTVVILQNLAYNNAVYFADADAVIVPSYFAQKHYADKLGIQSVVIPPLLSVDTPNMSKDFSKRRYLTYINPEQGKGMTWFAKIARILNDKRPNIEILVVEGRGKISRFAQTGQILSGVRNLHVMPNTPNPADFLQVSKIVLMPSYYEETFGRVAAEAMLNGIPVIVSNRGALPEVVGSAGFVLAIPDHFQPDSLEIPSDTEVEEWIDAIIQLWYNFDYYNLVCQKCLEFSTRWRWETVASQYASFFLGMI